METSDQKMEPFIDLRNGTFMFTYNHKRVVVEDEIKHQFDFVIIPSQSREAAIAALVHKRYSIDAEIALINNRLIDVSTSSVEYNDYQDYRSQIKAMVDLSISGNEETE